MNWEVAKGVEPEQMTSFPAYSDFVDCWEFDKRMPKAEKISVKDGNQDQYSATSREQ